MLAAVPINFITAKNDFEKVVYGDSEMTRTQNFLVTIVFCVVCWLLAVVVPNIAVGISILGCTTNPMSGFIFPILFFLKMFWNEKKSWKLKTEFILCWLTLILVIAVSITSLVLFILDPTQS